MDGKEETELNGVEEEQDKMSDEEERVIDGEGELAVPDWKVRQDPQADQHKEKERSMKGHTCHFVTGVPIITLQDKIVKISREGLSSQWITSS